ncbi:hypothetical protein [Calothrix sp. NIES-2098]|uniref:hypothetical protein n=1 Tax=Calothrix sp. NIES-2098 TaxID=1954171 RepID=UPI000B615E8E|nr:hypothetical protein NIES2098_06100 [Calothrix sp. NIES-2098]
MDWLPLFDPSQLGDFLFAQTPAPSPSPLPIPTPARTLDVELLKSQLEFLKDANTRLGESFNKFVGAMQFTLVVFAFLGAVLAFIFGKNLDDAKKVASDMIRQEVNNNLANLVKAEVENIKRTLQRERVIGLTIVEYYLPSTGLETKEFKLLKQRGFQKVRFWNEKSKPKNQLGGVLVLDLVNSNLLSGQDFTRMSEAEAANKKEEKVKEQIDLVLKILPPATVLVVYVNPGKQRIKAIDDLASQVEYYASANAPVTLMGIVTDSAYVAYGDKVI